MSRSFVLLCGRTFLILLWVPTLSVQAQALESGQTTPRPPFHILALGDSLTAGYGLPRGASFADRLQQALRASGHTVRVTNAGISGDTTTGGKTRLAWSLEDPTNLVILELGANDALRGISPDIVRKNLRSMINQTLASGSDLLLCGMTAPLNFGPVYKKQFDAIFPELAKEFNIPLYPFFLQGVLGKPDLTQDDGLHPNLQGVDEIVRRILPVVEDILQKHASSQ